MAISEEWIKNNPEKFRAGLAKKWAEDPNALANAMRANPDAWDFTLPVAGGGGRLTPAPPHTKESLGGISETPDDEYTVINGSNAGSVFQRQQDKRTGKARQKAQEALGIEGPKAKGRKGTTLNRTKNQIEQVAQANPDLSPAELAKLLDPIVREGSSTGLLSGTGFVNPASKKKGPGNPALTTNLAREAIVKRAEEQGIPLINDEGVLDTGFGSAILASDLAEMYGVDSVNDLDFGKLGTAGGRGSVDVKEMSDFQKIANAAPGIALGAILPGVANVGGFLGGVLGGGASNVSNQFVANDGFDDFDFGSAGKSALQGGITASLGDLFKDIAQPGWDPNKVNADGTVGGWSNTSDVGKLLGPNGLLGGISELNVEPLQELLTKGSGWADSALSFLNPFSGAPEGGVISYDVGGFQDFVRTNAEKINASANTFLDMVAKAATAGEESNLNDQRFYDFISERDPDMTSDLVMYESPYGHGNTFSEALSKWVENYFDQDSSEPEPLPEEKEEEGLVIGSGVSEKALPTDNEILPTENEETVADINEDTLPADTVSDDSEELPGDEDRLVVGSTPTTTIDVEDILPTATTATPTVTSTASSSSTDSLLGGGGGGEFEPEWTELFPYTKLTPLQKKALRPYAEIISAIKRGRVA